MLFTQKFLSVLLALALVLVMIPAKPAMAAGQGSLELGENILVEMPLQNATTSVGESPILADGNYERWIDRIGNLPDYSVTFYTWLEENANAEGALADPAKGTLYKENYTYLLATIPASADFTYTSDENPADAALAAARSHANAIFSVVMDHGSETYSAFHRDHPEVFWLSGASSYTWSLSYSYSYADGSGTVSFPLKVYFYLQTSTFDIRDTAFRDVAAISDGIVQRNSDVARILADCPTDTTVYEQLRYLNKTLTETNEYNTSASTSVSILPWQCLSALGGADSTHGPVCEGYAKAFKVLCDELDIPCVLVEGDARSSKSDIAGAHMWNYVQVDGGWYAVDVTWNDPLVSGSSGAISGSESEEWFLLGSDSLVDTDLTFLDSHPVTNVVTNGGLDFSNGPLLEAQAYTPNPNYMDIAPYRGAEGYTAPVREGQLFAGWYTDAALTQPLGQNVTSGYAYAKFVDEQTLTLKFQITGSTTAASDSTDLRLLTAVNSLDMNWVSFETVFGDAKLQSLRSTHVYSQVNANGVSLGAASEHFGSDAGYYATFTITGVPQSAFDTTFTVTPSWQTLDGTQVFGAERSFTISQAF